MATSSRVTPPNGKTPAAWKRPFARRLVAWYRRHRRELPWRSTDDPYATWISEIMLQQTQVVTVVPYFERFMAAFPNIRTLAAADEHDVLRLWEGLGYYRRARQLHRAARILVDEHNAQIPRDLAVVRQLPGVGRYTAGAIVSIAFGLPAPILEANTVRLLSRLVGFRGDTASASGQRQLWQLAEAILPSDDCGTFNQALMELGSQVCTPREPACPRCPVRLLCTAHRDGSQHAIGRLRAKPRAESVREAAIVIWRGRKVLLRRCPPGERWAGLWDFPRFRVTATSPEKQQESLLRQVRENTGLAVCAPALVATIKHGVTRFRITLDCYEARRRAGRVRLPEGTWRWVSPDDLHQYALSTTGRKLGGMLTAGARR
jgi:A/G-specific adenine glycosylase